MATILIVDDAEDVLEMLASLVRAMGHVALTAVNGVRGLALIQEARPDLVLLDVRMPGMNGLDVLATLRANPSYHRPRVAVMTASPDPATERRALKELGADAFVDKVDLDVPQLLSLFECVPMAA